MNKTLNEDNNYSITQKIYDRQNKSESYSPRKKNYNHSLMQSAVMFKTLQSRSISGKENVMQK